MFNTNNKRHFLIYSLSNSTNFTAYTKEDGTTINNEDKKEC